MKSSEVYGARAAALETQLREEGFDSEDIVQISSGVAIMAIDTIRKGGDAKQREMVPFLCLSHISALCRWIIR
jgi:hypothetical protein